MNTTAKKSTVAEFAQALKDGKKVRLETHAAKVFEDYLFQFERDLRYLKGSINGMCQFEKV